MLIDDLTHLAHDPSPDRRRELLRKVSDMFVEGADHHSDLERELFGDVMARVVNTVEETARIELADRLAPHPSAPHDVILKLAKDKEEVASVVLRHSQVLTDEDLIEIASEKSDGHLVAIAHRQGVSAAVTHVLVDRGSDLVIETVAGNASADFSPTTFAKMTERAADNVAIQGALVSRRDLPTASLEALVPLLSDELSCRLAEQGYNLEEQLPDRLLAQLRTRLSSMVQQKERESRDVKLMLADIKAGTQTMTSMVVMLAGQDRAYDLAEALASLSKMDMKAVLGALLGHNHDPMIIVLRALDLDIECLQAVMELRAKRLRRTQRVTEQLKSSYLAMTPENAQRALRFHQVRGLAG